MHVSYSSALRVSDEVMFNSKTYSNCSGSDRDRRVSPYKRQPSCAMSSQGGRVHGILFYERTGTERQGKCVRKGKTWGFVRAHTHTFECMSAELLMLNSG